MPCRPHRSPSLLLSPALYILSGTACHCGRSRLNLNFLPHYQGPACHCGWSRPTLPPSLPSLHLLPSFLLSKPGLSLWQVPLCFFLPVLSLHSPLLDFPPPSLSLTSSFLPPRARRPPWEIQQWSCWRSATTDPQVILLATCSSTTTSLLSLESLAVPHSPEREVHWLDIAWLCFALDGHWTSWKVTSSLSSSFTTPSWTEWILRGLWDAHRCFTSSHQDQWWLSCACALHFLALQQFHSDDVVILPYTKSCSTSTLPHSFSSLHPSPVCHLVTSIHSMTPRPRQLCFRPVPPRYGYIPNNTSAVSVSLAPVLPIHLNLWEPLLSLHLSASF